MVLSHTTLNPEGEAAMSPPRTAKISSRAEAILSTIARYGRYSTNQVHSEFFPDSTLNAAIMFMSNLVAHHVISFQTYTPAKNRGKGGKEERVFYIRPQNLKNIRAHFSRQARMSEFQDLFDEHYIIIIEAPHGKVHTTDFLSHEVGNVDFMHHLKSDTTLAPDSENPIAKIHIWRMLGQTREIDKKFHVTIAKSGDQKAFSARAHLIPDLFYTYYQLPTTAKEQGSLNFYFHEHDNDSESEAVVTKKALAYERFRRLFASEFVKLVLDWATLYNLPITKANIPATGFFVSFSAPDESRRNWLCEAIFNTLKPEQRSNYLFAALPDIVAGKGSQPVWLNAKAYEPIAKLACEELRPNTPYRLREAWRDEHVADFSLMPRVTLGKPTHPLFLS